MKIFVADIALGVKVSCIPNTYDKYCRRYHRRDRYCFVSFQFHGGILLLQFYHVIFSKKYLHRFYLKGFYTAISILVLRLLLLGCNFLAYGLGTWVYYREWFKIAAVVRCLYHYIIPQDISSRITWMTTQASVLSAMALVCSEALETGTRKASPVLKQP